MGLLDWLKGGQRAEQDAARDPQEERVAAQRQDQEGAPETARGLAETPLERRNEEASRHSGI